MFTRGRGQLMRLISSKINARYPIIFARDGYGSEALYFR